MRSVSVLKPLLVLLLLAGALSSCRDRSPVSVGFVGGLSGRVADLGIAGRDGATLAIEEANAAGGVGGRPVELLLADDRQSPEVARQAFRELVRQGVRVVIGPMTSSMAMALAPLADETQVPLVSPTTSTNLLSGKNDHFFRVYPQSRDMARTLARFAYEKRGLRTFAVAYDLSNRSHTEDWMKQFGDYFEELGGQILLRRPFVSGEVESFSELSISLLASGADGVLILANAIDTAMICQQISKQKGDVALFVSEWSATRDLLSLGGRSVEGITLFHTFDRTSRDAGFIEFKRRFFERFGYEPGFAASHGYDAARLVLAALSTGKEEMKEALLAVEAVQGVQTRIELDPFGDIRRDSFLLQVRNGRFQSNGN